MNESIFVFFESEQLKKIENSEIYFERENSYTDIHRKSYYFAFCNEKLQIIVMKIVSFSTHIQTSLNLI